MEWFFLSIFCALSLATADMLSKKALKYSDESTISLIRFFFCLPPLYLMLYLNGIPDIKQGFWTVLILSTPLEIGAMLLYNRSIKLSPLSLTLPFLAFTPIFLLFTSFLMINETPNSYGLFGIILITIGGYMLNIDTKKGILYPLKAVLKERGSALMLIVAFLYSITSVFGKIMVDKSDFIFTPAAYFTVVTFFTAIIVSIKGNAGLKGIFNGKRIHLYIGIFSCLMIISHFIALSMTKVEYMISVKRSSMLFGIIYGGLIFKEVDIRKRFFSAVIMLIGIALIGIWGN
jgi:uncharacterized membrane protein